MAYLADKTPAELTAKTTPIDADLVILGDSTDASEVAKKVTWANIKATLKTYLDTLYAPVLGADDNYVTDAEKVVIGNTSGTNSGNETASTIGVIVNSSSAATPNDTDLVATVESSVVKKITWTNVKAFLKTYLDTLYQPLDSDLTTIAGLTATTDNFIVSVSSAWASRTPTQVRTTLNVEDGADVTDATNVAAAGAVMEGDTSTASMSFVIDEDNMASNSATKVPTQQSVKAYADTKAPTASPTFTGVMDYVQADGNEVALGNLGATEAIDWATGVYFTGAIDQDVAITFTNEASGRGITLDLVGDGTQETITWTDVDVWLDGASGAAPAAPTLSTEHLIVTLKRIGSTTFASATGNYALY